MTATEELDPTAIPEHVAVIMDGNGRWAKKRGLPRTAGHRAGMKALKTVVRAAPELGIRYLTVYAFSTENWKRPAEEVGFLMDLMTEMMKREIRELHGAGVRIRILGDLSAVPEKTLQAVLEGVELTRSNTGLQLNIAFNYGGRQEILSAIRTVLESAPGPEEITEDYFSGLLYTKDIPDPDLVIRTSGELRISNFLLWQLAYAELYVTEVLWPDFGREDLILALKDYQARGRRFGGI